MSIFGNWTDIASSTGQSLIGMVFTDENAAKWAIPLSNYTTSFTNDGSPDQIMFGPVLSSSTRGISSNGDLYPNIDVDSITSKYPKQTVSLGGPITFEKRISKYYLSMGWYNLFKHWIDNFAAAFYGKLGTYNFPMDIVLANYYGPYKLEKAGIHLTPDSLDWDMSVSFWGLRDMYTLYPLLFDEYQTYTFGQPYADDFPYHYRAAKWYDCYCTMSPVYPVYPTKLDIDFSFEAKEIYAINRPFANLTEAYERGIGTSGAGGPVVLPTRIVINYDVEGLWVPGGMTSAQIADFIRPFSKTGSVSDIKVMIATEAMNNYSGTMSSSFLSLFVYDIINRFGTVPAEREMNASFFNTKSSINFIADNLTKVSFSGNIVVS